MSVRAFQLFLHTEGNSFFRQFLRHGRGILVGTVNYRRFVKAFRKTGDFGCNALIFLISCGIAPVKHRLPGRAYRLRLFYKTAFICGNKPSCSRYNFRRAAVILCEFHDTCLRIILPEAQHDFRPRAAEGINRLVVVSYDKQVVFRLRKQAQHLILHGIDILEFIHQNVAEFLLPGLPYVRPGYKQITAS